VGEGEGEFSHVSHLSYMTCLSPSPSFLPPPSSGLLASSSSPIPPFCRTLTWTIVTDVL
jgi:hypothetical protein